MDVIRLEAGALKEAVKLSEYAFQYKVEEQSLEARLKRTACGKASSDSFAHIHGRPEAEDGRSGWCGYIP